jgi:hypothetical protein
MQEQRLTYRLQTYWDMLKKDKHFPDARKFDVGAVEDIWANCFRVSVNKTHPPTFTYEYMGENVSAAYGKDLQGMTVDPRMAFFPGSVLHRRLENIVHMKIPMQDNGHLINYDGKIIRYRACLLPLGTEKDGVTHIICGLSFRYF